jgi:hypothetical protein
MLPAPTPSSPSEKYVRVLEHATQAATTDDVSWPPGGEEGAYMLPRASAGVAAVVFRDVRTRVRARNASGGRRRVIWPLGGGGGCLLICYLVATVSWNARRPSFTVHGTSVRSTRDRSDVSPRNAAR